MFQLETGLSRRNFLQSGAALSALMLPQVSGTAQPAQSTSGPTRRAKSVIFLVLEGGMSHFESWDPKPNAPREIRGSFENIATTNPQLRIGEHMPLLAKQAHLYNVVRSVHSAATNHSPGLHWILTGYANPAASVNGIRQNIVPSVGSIVSHQLGNTTPEGLPNYVAIPNRTQLGGRVNYSGGSHLGASFDALNAGTIPAKSNGKYVLPAGLTLPREISVGRLQNRRDLLSSIDNLQRKRERSTKLQGINEYQQQAFDMLLGRKGQAAFDINRESAQTRALYGDSVMGQGTLLARRLVETGVTFVMVNYSKNNSWDTHRNNFNSLKTKLLPPMDQAVSALMSDLEQRGMLDDTLVLMMGEMGRTPVINNNNGRDHWANVYSALIAGGGLTRGQLLGSSTRDGGLPLERPVHVQELLATLYTQLGIDPELRLPDRENRLQAIFPTSSQPVNELILV